MIHRVATITSLVWGFIGLVVDEKRITQYSLMVIVEVEAEAELVENFF